MDLETPKEQFNSLKVVQKRVLEILACPNVLSCLRKIVVIMGPRADIEKDTH